MKTSSRWDFRSIVGRLILGSVLALMIGTINVVPAFSKDNDRRVENHRRVKNDDHNRYEHERRWNAYERNDHRRNEYKHPPVIYVSPPPPGIRIFFPPIIINP